MVSFSPRNILDSIALIENSTNISILTHMHPDGDAMGSSIGLLRFLEDRGKKVRILLNDRYPAYLSFMTKGLEEDRIICYDENREAVLGWLRKSGLMICLDFNNLSRTDSLERPALESGLPKILIDHHLSPAKEEFDIVFSETEISSASELAWWFLKEVVRNTGNGPIPLETMTALMTGMTTDTNNFANSVFPSTLQMASELLAAGVDRDSILSDLYNKLSENRLRLMGYLMKDVLEITEDGVAFITLSKEDAMKYNIREGETEGFVNMPLSIGRVKMSIFSKEDEGKARISIRSKKGTSANRCAREWFNGGGHEQAAGGKLVFGTDLASFSEVPDYIRTRTHKFMNSDE